METQPTAFHSLDERVSESQTLGKAIIFNPSIQDKKAPRAEPEEDIDMEENQKSPNTEMAVTSETKDFIVISQFSRGETENMTAHLESKSTEIQETLCEDDFPPPPPAFSDLSGEEGSDKDFSIEVNDISDQINELDSQGSQEWHKDIFTLCKAVDTTTMELKFLPDGFTENVSIVGTSSAVCNPPFDDCDEHIVCSPPFADASEEEEEEASLCTVQNATLDNNCDVPALPVVAFAEQQGELFQQCELPPLGVNQEATQQVLGQVSPPLSTVSMETSNQAAQGDSCVVAIRESRVGLGEEGESRQISSEERQFKSGQLELNKEEGQRQIRGVLKSVQIQEQKAEKCRRVSFQHSPMESDSCDDSQSDSGLSADFSPCSTLESNTTISTGSPASVLNETPIEREIRRAIEREHSLRRSRGLPSPPTSPQYVDIPLRKTILCQSLPPTKSDRCQGKDRHFAGKKMQHDIHEEAKREHDLVKLGKVPGVYDKGTVRQLKERKQLFEAFQKPTDSSLTGSIQSKTTSCSSDISISQNDSSFDKSKVTHETQNDSNSKNELTSKTVKSLNEGTGCPVIIIENHLSVPTKRSSNTKVDAITVVDSSSGPTRITGTVQEKVKEEDQDLAHKENPFFKLRSSTAVVKVEQDIREAQERERELRKQRVSLYGSARRTKVDEGGVKAAGKEEHSSTLSPLNGSPVEDLPGMSQTGATTTAARNSLGKLGVWPPAPTENNNQMEVPHCAWTPRQKTPLVQRWESGLINGHSD